MKTIGRQLLRATVLLFSVSMLSGYVAWRQEWWEPRSLFSRSVQRAHSGATDTRESESRPRSIIIEPVLQTTLVEPNGTLDPSSIEPAAEKGNSFDPFGKLVPNGMSSYIVPATSEPISKTTDSGYFMPGSKNIEMPLFKFRTPLKIDGFTVEENAKTGKSIIVPTPPNPIHLPTSKSGPVFIERDIVMPLKSDPKPSPTPP